MNFISYTNMICVKSLQLEKNKLLLLMVGLWPYERSKLVQLQLTILNSVLITFILVQCTTFATSELTSQIIIEILTTISASLASIIMYYSFIYKMNVVKDLLEILQYTYDGLRDKMEVSILEKYGNIAKNVTVIGSILLLCSSPFLLYPYMSYVLDVILPLSEPRPHPKILIRREYFIDQEKYFYIIETHGILAMCIGCTAILATGTLIITYFIYSCGMLKIASYRIEQAVEKSAIKHRREYENFALEKIACAVDIHRKAMKFVNTLISRMHISYLLLVTTVMLSTCLNLFCIFQGMFYGYTIEKFMLFFIVLLACYIAMFLANTWAQQIMDHNNDIFNTVYNVHWYMTPLSIQRVILFLLQRGTKTYNIKLGGIFVGSLEGFATMISMSISYFTFLYSTETNE